MDTYRELPLARQPWAPFITALRLPQFASKSIL